MNLITIKELYPPALMPHHLLLLITFGNIVMKMGKTQSGIKSQAQGYN